MKLAAIGVGNAGSRIVNQLLDVERASGMNLCRGYTLLVNSTTPRFDTTEYIPDERRLTIGDVQWEADRVDISGDPDLGAAVAREERNEINRTFDLIEFHEVDGVLVVAGLGGGTGGGAGAVVIDQLKSITDLPVFGVGVLPSESEGPRPALTAARSLQSFVARANTVITFDNDTWLADGEIPSATADTDDSDATADADDPDATADTDDSNATERAGGYDGAYAEVNQVLAERLFALFAAGEEDAALSETRLDPSDIIRTLDAGGLSSIGYASTDLPQTGGIGAWMRSLWTQLPWTTDAGDDDEPTDAARIHSVVRRAARSKLTLPCTVSSADRALIVLSGPSRTLSRKGFESGRYWLEREADIVDVMAGDEPHEGATSLTAVVLFSNVTEVPRIKAMQEMALRAPLDETADENADDSQSEWRFGTVSS